MRWLIAPFLALSLTSISAPAATPEIWFAPHSRVDMANLWSDSAPWQQAAKKVGVVQVVSWWLVSVPDAEILALFDFAKRHHMKVEMETSVIARDRAAICGNIEGYTAPDEMTAQFAVLRRLNLHIDILTMDEPVWFGHYLPGPTGCNLEIPELVDRIFANIKDLLNWYPNLQLVEIEPVPALTNHPDWRVVLTRFRNAMARKTGKKIQAIQLDLDWGNPGWKGTVRDVHRFVRLQGMRLGVYMYGGAFDRSDAAWIGQAEQHMDALEGELGIIPDQAIFASWSQYPVHTLPETSPSTLTWLINRYVRERTLFTAQFVGPGVRGRLTDQKGKPIANATINGYVPGVDFFKPLPTTVINDVVPAGAAYGLIGYRLNVECFCAGLNDVLVGLLRYQETQGGTASFNWTFPLTRQTFNGAIMDTEWVGGTQVTRVIATPGQALAFNSAFFPVTPAARYTYTVPASTIGGTGWFGHAILYWFDRNKNGLPGSVFVIPDPDRRLMSTATTAADGSFLLKKLPMVGPGSAPVMVQFAGDSRYRGVTWTPLR